MEMRPGGGVAPPGMRPNPMGPAGHEHLNQSHGNLPLVPRFGNGGNPRLPQSNQGPGASPELPRFDNGQNPDAHKQGQHRPLGNQNGAPTDLNPGANQQLQAGNPQSPAAQSNAGAERRLYRETLERARDAWAGQGHTLVRRHDPLAEAQAALKQLRNNPNDRKAADRLERALKRLEAERQKQSSGQQPAGPANR